MKKIKLVAKQDIINFSKKGVCNDEDIKALDGYAERVYEVEDDFDINKYVDMFEEEYPDFKHCEIRITIIDMEEK